MGAATLTSILSVARDILVTAGRPHVFPILDVPLVCNLHRPLVEARLQPANDDYRWGDIDKVTDVQETGQAQQDGLNKLREEIKGIRIAMLTTAEQDGTLRARPMGTQEMDANGNLWFFTSADSPKVDEVEQDRNVNITYVKPDDHRWVSISGKAALVRDKSKIKELWNPLLKAWFPKGLDDPELALLKVDIREAEYWESSNGAVVYAINLAKSIMTGKQPHSGDHQKLDLA